MRKSVKFFVVLLVIVSFAFLSGCNGYSQYPGAIREVKNSVSLIGSEWNAKGITIEESVNDLIGVKDTIDWRAFKPAAGDYGKYVIVVEASLTKKDKEGITHYLTMQYLFNKKTGVVEQGYVGLDDESVGLLGILEFYVLDY